jgi:hypothetical protein
MAEVRAVHHEEARFPSYAMAGGSALEGLAGVSALVLAILGLLGIYSFYMLSIATILVGAALILEGTALTARMATTMHDVTGGRLALSEFGSGIGVNYIGGITGIVLAIIAMAGVSPWILLPCAAIVYGVTHIFGTSAISSMTQNRYASEPDNVQRMITLAAKSTGEVQMFIGFGGLVLGVLALLGYVSMTLVLVSMLAFGFADMLRGPAVAARAIRRFL